MRLSRRGASRCLLRRPHGASVSTAARSPAEDGLAAGTLSSNITPQLLSKLGQGLHLRDAHPLGLIRRAIEGELERGAPGVFASVNDLDPRVTPTANFDDLLIGPEHSSRSLHDTFYYDGGESLLRTHTSAHQTQLLRQGGRAFTVTGDVYRRDCVDTSHYPVFHQMEGVRIFEQWGNGEDAVERVEADLKRTLDGIISAVFGNAESRWRDDHFPFTSPSFEVDIFFEGEWLEVLGCGVVHQDILDACALGHCRGWAFGLGLERLAMVLFGIPDIRLFWTQDERFHSQFSGADVAPGGKKWPPRFVPFSKFPPCFKDVSFWLPQDGRLDEHPRAVRGH